MLQKKIPIVGFAAFSGTGKTTLLTQLIPILKQHQLNIGLIKHSHHDFEIDKPGKDSYRLRQAGATTVLLASKHRRAIVTEMPSAHEPKLSEQLAVIDQTNLDLILVEGFKAECFPKIELYRPALKKPLLYPNDSNIVAVASDLPLSLPDHICGLDLNAPAMIATFILERFMRPSDAG